MFPDQGWPPHPVGFLGQVKKKEKICVPSCLFRWAQIVKRILVCVSTYRVWGRLGMEEKEKEEYYFFLTLGLEGSRGPRKVTVTHWP